MNIKYEIEYLKNAALTYQNYDLANTLEYLLNRINENTENAKKAWIKTFTGKRVHAFDPNPDELSLIDIAHALSFNNRFTGHAGNYTVGLHSIHVYNVLKNMGQSIETCLMGLLHDGSEAYLQDIAKPFKNFLPDYQNVEESLQNTIFKKYIGYIPTDEDYAIVKVADEVLLYNEVKQLMPQDVDWTFTSGLPDIYVNVQTKFPQDYIKHAFLEIANELGARD